MQIDPLQIKYTQLMQAISDYPHLMGMWIRELEILAIKRSVR